MIKRLINLSMLILLVSSVIIIANAETAFGQSALVMGLSGDCDRAIAAAQPEVTACNTAQNTATTKCERIQMTAAMMGLATTAAQAIGSNDQKKLCETSMALNTLMGAANVTFGMMCSGAAKTCQEACKEPKGTITNAVDVCTAADEGCIAAAGKAAAAMAANPAAAETQRDLDLAICGKMGAKVAKATAMKSKAVENIGVCGGNKSMSTMAYMQAGMNAITAAQSLGCRNSAEDVKCDKIADIKDPKKPSCYFQLCGPGGRFDGTTECSPTELDCTASVNFGAPYCVCKSNPQDPVCPGSGNASGGSSGSGSGGLDGGTGGTGGNTGTYGAANADGNFADDDLTNALGGDPEGGDPFGNKNNNPAGAAQAAGQPGSPFSPGGGFNGNPGANPGKGGAGKGPYNTDILQGPGGASGYTAGGAGEYPFGSNGADAKDKDGMNLRDFLPGGKRGIAGQKELEKNGVSNATGLSNFEKVTRQVNQLRRNKQTIETK